MATYIILSKILPEALSEPREFRGLADKVKEHIKRECPDVHWKDSYATLGQYDVIDVVESEDVKQVEKAAMIIRTYGNSTTETMLATPWKEFLAAL